MKFSNTSLCLLLIVTSGCSSSITRFAMNNSLATAESAEASVQQAKESNATLRESNMELRDLHREMKELAQSATNTSARCEEKAALHHLQGRAR